MIQLVAVGLLVRIYRTCFRPVFRLRHHAMRREVLGPQLWHPALSSDLPVRVRQGRQRIVGGPYEGSLTSGKVSSGKHVQCSGPAVRLTYGHR